MKIFKTNSKETVTDCQLYFGLPLVADVINFLSKISITSNVLCKLLVSSVSSQMNTLCLATLRPATAVML